MTKDTHAGQKESGKVYEIYLMSGKLRKKRRERRNIYKTQIRKLDEIHKKKNKK